MKIGSKLLEESIKWLDTTKPLITFPEYKLELFKPIIDKYNWKLTEIESKLYNNKSNELCFNGLLIKDNNGTLEQKLHKRLIKILKINIENN